MGVNSPTIEELRKQTIARIKKELEYCNIEDTPIVCEMIKNPEDRKKIIELILDYVGNAGQTISQAIVSIERENDPRTQSII